MDENRNFRVLERGGTPAWRRRPDCAGRRRQVMTSGPEVAAGSASEHASREDLSPPMENGGEAASDSPSSGVPLSATPTPAEAVIRTFVDALAKLARTHRDAVREAGGIAPLVSLLRSGTPETKGLAAAVLRDLATGNQANSDAIIKHGGIDALVEMLRSGGEAAGEAAGALRALSAGFQNGCQAICAAGGIEAVIEMVRSGKVGTQAPIHATGVLANIAQSGESNCEAILRLGGVTQLYSLFNKDSEFAQGRHRIAPEMKQWLEKASEEAAHALWQLAANAPSCNVAIREANAIQPLVETLLRSGLESTTANHCAKALVELIQSDEASKMVALNAISTAAKNVGFSGHGWSLYYPLLRHLLQGAAERLLKKEQEGTSIAGITYALDVARAVELPQTRIDVARGAFDESKARQIREKMAVSADERRKQKEEEVAALKAARDKVDKIAIEHALSLKEAEAAGSRGRVKRKDMTAEGEQPSPAEKRKVPLPAGAPLLSPSARSGPPLPAGARPTSKSTMAYLSSLGGDMGSSPATPATTGAAGTPASVPAAPGTPGMPGHNRADDAKRGSSSARLSRSNSLSRRSARSDGNPLGGLPSGRKSSPGKRVVSNRPGTYPAADVVVRPLHRETPLHFMPRAQLLQKIEQMAAMSRADGLGVAKPISAEAKDLWHHRWDHKYGIGVGSSEGDARERQGGDVPRAPPPPAAPPTMSSRDRI